MSEVGGDAAVLGAGGGSGAGGGAAPVAMRSLPEPTRRAQQSHDDPDQEIIAMLDAWRLCWPTAEKVAANNGRTYG